MHLRSGPPAQDTTFPHHRDTSASPWPSLRCDTVPCGDAPGRAWLTGRRLRRSLRPRSRGPTFRVSRGRHDTRRHRHWTHLRTNVAELGPWLNCYRLRALVLRRRLMHASPSDAAQHDSTPHRPHPHPRTPTHPTTTPTLLLVTTSHFHVLWGARRRPR